jgi:osmotically-inducible protein OsmY
MDLQPRIAEPLVNDPVADDELRRRAILSLGRAGFSSLSRLEVHAGNGTVTLRGAVPTYYLRQLAVAGAKQVAGVRQVVDEISVAYPETESDNAPIRRPK